MKVGLVYSPVYLEHDTGIHVENPGRLEAITSRMEETDLISRLIAIPPRAATLEELTLIHELRHIQNIRSISQTGGGWIDADTTVSPGSYEAAVHAAGGAIRAAESVMDGETDSAFALVRPPGHHATPDRAMGFCLFNNAAIAAAHILSKYNMERLAIIDFDVHHGNGTQAAFYSDPRVLYVSIHQHPLYPGTGFVDETGAGEAEGTTVNIALPPHCGDTEYGMAFEEVVAPAVRRYNPEFILVSAGFDSHWTEKIASMQVSVSGFGSMMSTIKTLAGEVCRNRLAVTLEGGYNLEALAASVTATFEILLGKEHVADPLGPSPCEMPRPDILPLIRRIREAHGL